MRLSAIAKCPRSISVSNGVTMTKDSMIAGLSKQLIKNPNSKTNVKRIEGRNAKRFIPCSANGTSWPRKETLADAPLKLTKEW